MNEQSILKQSLVFTGKLVGVSVLWVALVSLILVTITGRAVDSFSGRSDEAGKANGAVEIDSHAKSRTPAPANPAKPNG
jgi:hypothetical protein